MTKVETIERQIEDLSRDELGELRRWWAEFDAAVWDAQIEADAEAGRLDGLAAEALRDHAARRTTEI